MHSTWGLLSRRSLVNLFFVFEPEGTLPGSQLLIGGWRVTDGGWRVLNAGESRFLVHGGPDSHMLLFVWDVLGVVWCGVMRCGAFDGIGLVCSTTFLPDSDPFTVQFSLRNLHFLRSNQSMVGETVESGHICSICVSTCSWHST